MINLTPKKEEGTISLGQATKLPTDEKIVNSRVQKADYALAHASPGQAELNASFWQGMEDRVREQAALAEAMDKRENWQQTSADVIREASLAGRKLSPEEQAYVLDVPLDDANPETALEERYARRYTKDVAPELEQDYPEVSQESQSVVVKQQGFQKVFEDIKARHDESTWGEWGWDFAKGLVPFYTWSKMADRIEGLPTSSVLTGSNVEEQMRGLYLLPADEGIRRLREAVDQIAEDNLIDAMMFAQAAVSYSSSDKFLDNAFFGLDTVDVATLGASVVATKLVKGAGHTARTAAKMKQAVAESANPRMTNVDKKVIEGDVTGAAKERVLDKLEASGLTELDVSPNVLGNVTKSSPRRVLDDISHDSFGLGDPEAYTRTAGDLSGERARRYIDHLRHNDEVLRSSLDEVTHVLRTDAEAAPRMFKNAETDFLRTNYRLEDSIVNIENVRESEDVFGGVDYVHFVIGKKDASGFVSPEQAATYGEKIYRLPKGSYDVAQRGDSYFLSMRKYVREDSEDVLDLRLTTDNQAPVNLKNIFLGWARNPDDLRGKAPSDWAKTATYGGNIVMAKMSEVAKSIGRLGKNESERLSTIIDEAQTKTREVLDPETGEKIRASGVFYKDVSEFERAYHARGWTAPSDKEILAYFSFRQLTDYDWAVRNISVWRDKARLGYDQKSVGWIHVDDAGNKVYKQTPFFEGRTLDELPSRSNEEYTIAWYNGKTGKTNFKLSSHAGQSGRRLEDGTWLTEIDELLEQGYRVIQLADPFDKKLQGFIDTKGEPVQYMLVRDMKEKGLSSNQVPWNEGGHWMYPQTGFYLKQPRSRKTGMGRRIYSGDMTVHHLQSTKQGQQFHEAYETARKMILADDPALNAFAQKNLPYDGDELRKLFEDGTFDKNTPFVLTQSGQTGADVLKLEDIFGEPVVNVGRSEHSGMATVNSKYAQERGERLTSIRNTGTEANPLYKLTGAPLIDGLSALKRSTSELARSRYFDDYKHRVVENYITQFKDILDYPVSELRANPMKFIHEPKFKKGASKAAVAAAKNSRRSLIYLMGQDTLDMGAMKHANQKLVDAMFDDKAQLLDAWKWGDKASDPSVVARSAVFQMKLGMFNPLQFPLQAQAILNVAAIDGNPIRAAQANFLYWSMRMRGLSEGNPKAQSKFGRAASRALGVKQSVVDEMYEVYKNTGASLFEGEFARIDDYLNPEQLYGKGVKGAVSKGLDAGTFFFREGNMMHRGVAFSTAFLAWRAKNPTKRLVASEYNKIIARTDDLYQNMSRASNNDILASSVPSVPTQFITYHKNLSEQLLGKRLTRMERLRLFGMTSTVYGLPVGVGLSAAPIWPVHESIRQYTLENGIDTDSNLIADFLMNGAAKVIMEYFTDEDWDFGGRYGPGGLDWLRDLRDGLFFEVIAGASGTSLGSAMERASPFLYYVTNVFAEESDVYPVTKADWLNAAREISSVNNVARAYAAANAQAILTKQGETIMDMDVDTVDVIMMAFGLSPQEVSDFYIMKRSNAQDSEAKAEITKTALESFRRGVKASVDGDAKAAEEFYTQAHLKLKLGGFTPQERKDVWTQAMREYGPLLDRVERQFMLRDPDTRMKNYQQRVEE